MVRVGKSSALTPVTLEAFPQPPGVLLQERGAKPEQVVEAVLEGGADGFAVGGLERDPVVVGEPVERTGGGLTLTGSERAGEQPRSSAWRGTLMPATSITGRPW